MGLPKKKTEQLSARVEPAVKKAAERWTKKNGVTMSELIERSIKAYIEVDRTVRYESVTIEEMDEQTFDQLADDVLAEHAQAIKELE